MNLITFFSSIQLEGWKGRWLLGQFRVEALILYVLIRKTKGKALILYYSFRKTINFYLLIVLPKFTIPSNISRAPGFKLAQLKFEVLPSNCL